MNFFLFQEEAGENGQNEYPTIPTDSLDGPEEWTYIMRRSMQVKYFLTIILVSLSNENVDKISQFSKINFYPFDNCSSFNFPS